MSLWPFSRGTLKNTHVPPIIKALARARAVRKKKPNRQKSEGACQCLMPLYVFHDSEQKVEFEARIKPCSHQLNCMKFRVFEVFL